MSSALKSSGSSRAWRKLRAAAADRLAADGAAVCWRCGLLVTPDQPWCLGHVVDRALGGDDQELMIEHQRCSESAGHQLGGMITAGKSGGVVRAEPGELFPRGGLLGGAS